MFVDASLELRLVNKKKSTFVLVDKKILDNYERALHMQKLFNQTMTHVETIILFYLVYRKWKPLFQCQVTTQSKHNTNSDPESSQQRDTKSL